MFKNNRDLAELLDDMRQAEFVLRYRRATEELTPEQIRMVDDALDDMTALGRSVSKLIETPYVGVPNCKQECFKLNDDLPCKLPA